MGVRGGEGKGTDTTWVGVGEGTTSKGCMSATHCNVFPHLHTVVAVQQQPLVEPLQRTEQER